MVPLANDTFTGWATIGLGAVTVVLAVISVLALREAQRDRGLAKETLEAQNRPVLLRSFVDSSREDRVNIHARDAAGSYGVVTVRFGEPIVRTGLDQQSHVCVCSAVVRNVGNGPAEIRAVRLMSLDTESEGGGAQYVNGWPEVNVLAVRDWTRIHADLLPREPPWFRRTVAHHNKLWFEVTYADLDGFKRETRWLELRPVPGNTEDWEMGRVSLQEPTEAVARPPFESA